MSSKIRQSDFDAAIAGLQSNIQRSVSSTIAGEIAASTGPFTTRLDDSSAPLIYSGEAMPGTLETDPGWRIKRIDVTGATVVLWAHGNARFDNVWADRASLSYS